MKIALDVMGGDFAPGHNLDGAKLALEAYSNFSKLFLVGDESTIKKGLDHRNIRDPRVEIVHASQVIEMSDPATDAIKKKKDSSITVAIDLVKRGDAQAVVSPGHTGAAVAAATIKLGRLKGVDRPGIASPLPNKHGACNLMDAGANPEAKAIHLFQYAIMGHVLAQKVYGQAKPVIGLMSVGEEDEKGTELTQKVFGWIKETDLNFRGNVEGTHLFREKLDVVVCDGFIGNVILKSCEATAKAVLGWIRESFAEAGPLVKLGGLLAKPAFKAAKHKGDYESYGGSPLLGLKGVLIIGHGSSSPVAIQNGVRVAVESLQHQINPQIEEALDRYAHIPA